MTQLHMLSCVHYFVIQHNQWTKTFMFTGSGASVLSFAGAKLHAYE